VHPVLVYGIAYVVALIACLFAFEALSLEQDWMTRLLVSVPVVIAAIVGTLLIKRFPFDDPADEDRS